MAYTSEIDKLEARWRENPKGRNFAPLADAYRKAGLIDNAIDLLQNGLKLHPDYVSAHIVYARCLIDKKDDAGAQDVFRKVLTLDGENIIALRGLAEIAERNGRAEETVEWLSRLLNADPMNGDAAEALARAKGRVAAKPMAAAAAPTVAMSKPDFTVEHEERVETTLSAKPSATPEVENFENPISFNPNAHAAAKADGLEVQEDVELNSQQIEQVEVEGLARTQYEGSGMFKLDTPSPRESESRGPDLDEGLPQVDLPLLMPDDAAMPRRHPAPPPPAAPPPAPLPPPPAPQARASASVPRSSADDDGAADTATLSQAEPVLTETMAELYLKQGHAQDALRVYQALLVQRPDDARLKSKIERLASGGRKGSGMSAQAFLKGVWSGRAKPPQQTTLEAAFDAAGAGAGSGLPGEPSRPAEDHISLDSVFGGSQQAAAPDTRSGTSGAPGAAEGGGDQGGQTGGFSFDEFFAGGKPGASPRTPGSSGVGRAQKPAEDEVEADQFQQWLKKLKS